MFEQAAAQGQTIVAAAGDEGSEDCYASRARRRPGLQVDDPASQPWVTGVGGTDARRPRSAAAESVWNTGRSRGPAGVGTRRTWTMPSWQLGPGVESAVHQGARLLHRGAALPGELGRGHRVVPGGARRGGRRRSRARGFATSARASAGVAEHRRHQHGVAAVGCPGRPGRPEASPGGGLRSIPPSTRPACAGPPAFNDVTVGEQPAPGLDAERPPRRPARPVLPGHAGLRPGHRTRARPSPCGSSPTLRSPPVDVCP